VQLKFFSVEAGDPSIGEGELNQFLRSHRILTIEKCLVQGVGLPSYWSVAVEYLDGVSRQGDAPLSGKTDFREILNEQDFALYCRLKDIRKAMAEDAGVPVYSIFTNRHLADMAQGRFRDATEISGIQGVGKKRAEKHSPPFLSAIIEFESKGDDKPNSQDGEPAGSVLESRPWEDGQA